VDVDVDVLFKRGRFRGERRRRGRYTVGVVVVVFL
jgi:hypothetical protein